MGDTRRRQQGNTVGPGVVKREIIRFLLLSDAGRASEGDIREHLLDCFQVSDRTTIRNQHLGYLKTKGVIDVTRQKGKDNFWFVVNSPSIAGIVYTEFEGSELVEIYRADFFQTNIGDWYDETRELIEAEIAKSSDEEIDDLDTSPMTWEHHYLTDKVSSLKHDVVKISPSYYYGLAPASAEVFIIPHLLMMAGKADECDRGIINEDAAFGFGIVLADLLVDFYRYAPLQEEILAFLKRRDVLQLFRSLYPLAVIGMVFRCMSTLHRPPPDNPIADLSPLYRVDMPDPLTIPPPPPGWEEGL